MGVGVRSVSGALVAWVITFVVYLVALRTRVTTAATYATLAAVFVFVLLGDRGGRVSRCSADKILL